MKILLLGGTSFFGKAIARRFTEAGHDVTLFTRGKRKPPDLPPHSHIAGDRNRFEDLAKAAKAAAWDIVIDNIGFDAEGARNALKAFASAKRYVFCSSVAVYRYCRVQTPQPYREEYSDFDYRPPEEDPSDDHWKYARGKLEAEREITRQDAVPWTILRPPVVYGPWDPSERGFWYLARLLKGGPILLPDSGRIHFRLAYSEDLARSFVEASLSAKAIGRIYNIAQSEIISLKDFIVDSAQALRVPVEIVSLPLELAGGLGGPFSTMPDFIADITKASVDLGHRPTPWREFCQITAVWFRSRMKDYEGLLSARSEELALIGRWRENASRFARDK